MTIPTKLPPRNSTTDIPPDLDDPHTSYQERILMLLDANDGRLWQREIVDVLDISKATVSRRLRDLENTEEIERIEFGGEKVVTLPERRLQFL